MASALAMENDRRSRLTAWTLVLSACAMSVVFLWPTWESLAGFWFGVNRYAHGPLIVGVFVYLLIHSRDRLQSSLPEPFLAALLPLGFLLCVWLVAVLASVQAIHQIMLPVILWTTFLVLLGWPIAKRLILPTAYLYLAIPVWESGNFILQWLTVKAVSVGLSVLSVPFLVDGNTISLPAGTFSVDDRCSGLHYLTVAIAISVLYALLWLKSNRNRVLLIALAILLALVTNWIRVFSVVYAGYLTDMQHYLVTQDHYYFGWVLFCIAMIPYLWFATRIENSENSRVAEGEAEQGHGLVQEQLSGSALFALAGCLTLMIVSTTVLLLRVPDTVSRNLTLELPDPGYGWTLLDEASADWQPYFVGASGEAFGTYVKDSDTVDVYTNLYRGQSQGRELIGYENRVEGDSAWSRTATRNASVSVGGSGQEWSVMEVSLRTPVGDRRIAYMWYDVGGRMLTGGLRAKLLFGINLLRGEPDAGATILSARCGTNCDNAREALKDWLEAYAQTKGVAG